MQILERAPGPNEMVVDLETLVVAVESPKLLEEGQVLSRILDFRTEHQHLRCRKDGGKRPQSFTFCEYWAIIRTSWKSYIPRATSKSWLTSALYDCKGSAH